MARTNSWSRRSLIAPESFLECLRYFLTPQVWKQAHQAIGPFRGSRWRPQALLFVLLTLTWCWGESLPERFETARAFYVASYQKRRRPGQTSEGWQKALARVPAAALRVVAAAVRSRLHQVFAHRLIVDGFIPLGCDGSRLQCPRSRELETRLQAGQDQRPPQVWVTAVVQLSLGLLWSWRLGKGTASERNHLLHLVATLPRRALLVADAGYVGYELLEALLRQRVAFLIRLSAAAPLYTPERLARSRFREGVLYYWPQWAQRHQQQPLRVRVLRLRSRGSEVWLMTSVLDPARLTRSTASTFYRWRWRNESLFRTYKRTLGKVKLTSRTITMIHREAEGSLLAVQLLLAQGALALPPRAARPLQPSARQVLLEIRAEVRNVTGMYLGPRQRQTYAERLRGARRDSRRRRRNQVRRRWPGRADHQPPRPPRILKMGTNLKELMAKTLHTAEAG